MFRRRKRHWERSLPWLLYLTGTALMLLLVPALTAWWTAAAGADSGVEPSPSHSQGATNLEVGAMIGSESISASASGRALQWKILNTGEQEGGEWFVKLKRSNNGKVETLPLDQYVAGVVAAEMPAEFPLEALKAQAIAARTYAVYHGKGSTILSDQVKDQVYLDEEGLRARWGAQYEQNWQKVQGAVTATESQILTYEGKPILALYFSTSNGFTENVEEYWQQALPYLRSVSSPWDQASPHAVTTKRMKKSDVEQELGVKLASAVTVQGSNGQQGKQMATVGHVLNWTTGKRVKTYAIEDKSWSGREIRERLQLKSAHFQLELEGDEVKVITYGYGHGVGMSQWGAAGMAEEGYTAEAILLHYYQGTKLAKLE